MTRIATRGGHAMERRSFVALMSGGLLAAPFVAEAQKEGKIYRIAYLGNSSAALESELVAGFRQGLRDLNYVEGQNIAIEYRWAEGRYDRFPALVAEAVQLKVDVIVAARAKAMIMVSDRALLAHRGRIVDFASRRRLLALYPYREFVQAGGLASYEPSYPTMFRKAATYVDKILKGT